MNAKPTKSDTLRFLQQSGLELVSESGYNVVRSVKSHEWDGITLERQYVIGFTYRGSQAHIAEREIIVGLTPEREQEARDPKNRNTTTADWLRMQGVAAKSRRAVVFSCRRVCNRNGQWTTVGNDPVGPDGNITCKHCSGQMPYIEAALTNDYSPEPVEQSTRTMEVKS